MSPQGDSPSESGRQAEIAEYQSTMEAIGEEQKLLNAREEAVSEQIGPIEVARLKADQKAFYHETTTERIEQVKRGEKVEEYEVNFTAFTLTDIKGQRHEEQFHSNWDTFRKWLEENDSKLGDFEIEAQELLRLKLLEKSFSQLHRQLWEKVVEARNEGEKLQRLEEFIEELGEEMPFKLIVSEAFEKDLDDLPPHLQAQIEEIRAQHPEIISIDEMNEGFEAEEEE